jgi:hypothetical protein
MFESRTSVEAHYSTEDLGQTILAALQAAGKDIGL